MAEDLETVTLRTELTGVMVECHRAGLTPLANDVSRQVLREFAEVIADKLRHRIGGRYVPKTADREERIVRNAAVCKAFTGRNHQQVMRQFSITRRLLYSILAEGRKGQGVKQP